MFLFWPWIALLAVCVLVIAILTIRFAGRVNLRPLDQRVKQDQGMNYGDGAMMGDPYDQQYPVGDDIMFPPGAGIAPGGGGGFQDPNSSIQFDEMTPSEVGGYPGSQIGGYPPSQVGGYPPSQVGGYPPSQSGGYPPSQVGGYPPSQSGGYPPSQMGGSQFGGSSSRPPSARNEQMV